MPLFITRTTSKGRDQQGEELLVELEALNQSLQYRSHTRFKSFANNRSTAPVRVSEPKPSQTHSLHPRPSFKVPFRSTSISCSDRPKRPTTKPLSHQHHQKKSPQHHQHHEKKAPHHHHHRERKSIWRWKPFRAISHMIMSSHRRIRVMFSLHVHRIEGLPVPMNGLRLTIRWICKEQGLQTMPSRIFHGIAEFGETLRHGCTMYSTRCADNTSRYDAKLCTLSVVALDVDELELAKHHVDLSSFLSQDVMNGIDGQDRSHSTSFELSGMAKGSTLIVTFSYDLVHHDTLKGNAGMHHKDKEGKKSLLVTKSLPLLKHGLPLIDLLDPSTSPSRSEPGADAARLHLNDIECLNLDEGYASHDSSMENRVQEASDLSDSAFSGSFEFKPDMNRVIEDDHQDDFSFPHTQDITIDSCRNSMPPMRDEGHLMGFPFSNKVYLYDNSNLLEEGACKNSTLKQPEACKLQETCDNRQGGSPTWQWSYEEAMFMRGLETEFEDEVDLVAEEFLNMLSIGSSSGHCHSDSDRGYP